MRSGEPSESLTLRRTWSELGEYLTRSPDPLRLLEIINLVAPRSWAFAFSFDTLSRTIVTISSKPRLGDSEVLSLVDGLIQELFWADELRLMLFDKTICATPTRALTASPDTNLLPASVEPPVSGTDESIKLIGYFGRTIPARVQRVTDVEEKLVKLTWFGSSFPGARRYSLDWRVLGRSYAFRPRDRLTVRRMGGDCFECIISLTGAAGQYLGRVKIATAAEFTRSEAFHIRFGEFDPTEVNSEFWGHFVAPDSFWYIELDEPHLQRNTLGALSPFTRLREVIEALEGVSRSIASSPAFIKYRNALRRTRTANAAAGLARRQDRAKRCARVWWHDRDVLCVPSNEMEVLALLCKLETLGALPLYHFKLVEYTARLGIDALVDFQIESTGHRVYLGSLELEHHFENFFDHEHPIEQVNLIVCWDFRDDTNSAHLTAVDGFTCLYRLTRREYSSWVLVLAKVPEIHIRQEA